MPRLPIFCSFVPAGLSVLKHFSIHVSDVIKCNLEFREQFGNFSSFITENRILESF